VESTDKRYFIILNDEVKKQIQSFRKSGNIPAIKKIQQLINELEVHPYTGTGKPEALKYNLSGFWSRRIDSKNRMIYSIEENIITVEILSAKGHYSDK